MSWETKPLKLKNGLPIPQNYDPQVDDWVPYTNEDIKALRGELALVKTELQTIKENQLSGEQKVRLDGTRNELIKEHVNQTINQSSHFFGAGRSSADVLNISKYTDVTILVENTGEAELQVLSITGYGSVTSNTRKLWVNNNGGAYWKVPAGASLRLSSLQIPDLKTPTLGLMVLLYKGGEVTTMKTTVAFYGRLT